MDIDIAKVLGPVDRKVRNFEKDGKPAAAVVLTRLYDTTVDDLWDALTSKERIPRWFLPIEGELKLGGKYQLTGNAGGTVTACTPPKHFAATWEFGGGVTWIDVTVSAERGQARMTLEHIAILEDHWTQFGPGAVGIGWDLGLMGLYLHFASGGKAVNPAEVAAWSASAAGKEFVTESGEAWRAAHVAGGEDPASAKERSDRTIGFYRGDPPAGTAHPGSGG
jgi:uncharacterized protein YndB with AHSA1/START domain